MSRTVRFEKSAGGLAVRRSGAALVAPLIGRSSFGGPLRWSLPKGHIERGETPELAAIREVAEETGIVAQVTTLLGTVSYTFSSGQRRIHKQVTHFLMEAVGGELSDADVEVTEVAWVPLGEIAARLAFPGERRLALRALTMLAVDS